jgi:hypothetical protein
MSDRAWGIVGAGIGALSIGVTFFAPVNKWIGIGGIVAGVLITAYGVIHDRLSSNKVWLVFSEDPPYTFRNGTYVYQVEYRVGVRGSRRVPKEAQVQVTNLEATPNPHPRLRADYPYNLPQRGQNGDRELLFDLLTTSKNAQGDLFIRGIQKDAGGDPDVFVIRPGEIWDIALLVFCTDARSLEAWFIVAVDAGGNVKVRRYSHKPATL